MYPVLLKLMPNKSLTDSAQIKEMPHWVEFLNTLDNIFIISSRTENKN